VTWPASQSPAKHRLSSFLRTSAIASGALLVLWSPGAHAQSAPSIYTTGIRYDLEHRVTGTIAPDPDGAGPIKYAAARNTYDTAGRLIRVENGELASWQSESVAPANWTGFTVQKSVDYTFDLAGRRTKEVLSAGGTAYSQLQYSYDSLDRVVCTAVRMDPSANFASAPADACTVGTTGTSGPSRITRNVYQSNRLVQVRRAVGTSDEQAYVTYTFTGNGLVDNTIDAGGNRAKFEYDGLDRQVKWTFPATAAPYSGYNPVDYATAVATAGQINPGDYEQYGYDGNGNRTSRRTRSGSTLTFSYDALNRITVKVVPERAGLAPTNTRDVYYGYDLRGLMLFARFDSASGEGITNSFDGAGRLTSSTQTMDGVNRTVSSLYDVDGNRTRMTFPDGNYAAYTYDGLDRPSVILRSGTAAIASYSYDGFGQRLGFTGAIATAYGYDPIGRLSTLANTMGGSSYNNQWTFAYNPAAQIVSMTRSNDAFAWTASGDVDRSYVANGLNQYTTAGAASFSYDAQGNLTGDGANSYAYDIENRLVGASGAHVATLRYDPLGRLYEVGGPAGLTRLLDDGDALVGEYDASGTLLRRYVHGADSTADDPIAWYEGSGFAATNERQLRPDWHASIVLVTDSAGAVLGINRYDEYGIPQSGNIGRFQYTGQAWLAELGMSYYKARFYSPTLGRFLQTDPTGYKDQVNLYAYVGNDPIDHIDPTGATCTSSMHENEVIYVCRIDKVAIVVNDKVVGTRDPTEKEQKRFDGFNRRYTAAVNALAHNPNRIAIVPNFLGGRGGFTVTGGSAAQALATREFLFAGRPAQSGMALGTTGGPAEGRDPRTYVFSDGLRVSSAGIVHDGLHGTSEEFSGGLQAAPPNRPLGTEPGQTLHQEPYNRAANCLLTGSDC
jgi:RHS repeat-associated protein